MKPEIMGSAHSKPLGIVVYLATSRILGLRRLVANINASALTYADAVGSCPCRSYA